MRFHVNIDHVATLRNARGTSYPDPVEAALICERAGAHGITAHLREDRRHIRDADIERLKSSVSTLLNLEMAATDEMIALAERIRPEVVTLVPERREERTTEGGLDVIGARAQIEKAARVCQRAKIKLSLFVEADEAQLTQSQKLGAQQVELHTGDYCNAVEPGERRSRFERLRSGARRARELGLEVAAGHGLTRDNLGPICEISEVEELNIGHAVIADAVFTGLDRAVREFLVAIEAGVKRRA
jgi:pyridoxine 5-phosphate synthase